MYITNEMYQTSYKEVFSLLISLSLEYKKLYEQEMSEVTRAILAN